MSLSLLQSYTAVANNSGLTVPFAATGGSAPYTFSVLPGGAGGSINGSTGVYTAPGNVGVDVIQVTDSTSPTPLMALGSLAVLTPLQLVADIIKTAMGLASDQVYLYDQKFNIPTDQRMYVAVGVNNLKPFGNRPRYVGGSSSLAAIQSVNVLANLTIHILSRSTTALFTKEQVLMALSSPYAEQQMELNGFFIAPITTGIVDISEVDGAAIPYHFVFSVNLQYMSTLSTFPSYFGSFSGFSIIKEPDLPEAFFITSATANGSVVTVDWSQSARASEYVVYRGSQSGIWPTVVGSTTSLTFSESLPIGTYYYSVVAVDDPGSTRSVNQGSVSVIGLALGLTSFWNLDDDFADDFNGNDLTNNNGVTLTPGLIGSSATFSSPSQQFLSHADNVSLQNTGSAYTLAFWVNYSSTSGVPVALSKWSGFLTNELFAIYLNTEISGILTMYVSGADNLQHNVNATSFGNISAGTWYFVVAWIDNIAGTINLQINNGAINTVNIGGPANLGSGPPLRFGVDQATNYLSGQMQAAGIWKRLLTSPEKTQLYNSGAGLLYPF